MTSATTASWELRARCQDALNTNWPSVEPEPDLLIPASHQVSLREYTNSPAGRPVSTGEMLGGPAGTPSAGGMATWDVAKKQARELLRNTALG